MDECIFCDIKKLNSQIIYEDEIWVAILDNYPVSKGHTLLIPKRHCETYFDLNEIELFTLNEAINYVRKILDKDYAPNGYNIGVNCGKVAGQSVMHCHIHIIPRYEGDVENPKGGIRGCIPSKMCY